MINEQVLKNRCSAGFYRFLKRYHSCECLSNEECTSECAHFPLLLYRAIEGLLKEWSLERFVMLSSGLYMVSLMNGRSKNIPTSYDYETISLTSAECGMLHCLLEVYDDEKAWHEATPKS